MSESNGHVLAYIHDGYTINGYIAAVPRLHPEMRFVYRPMLVQNRSVIFREIRLATDARKTESIAAAAIKSQLVSWDVVDHQGSAVTIEVPHALRLQQALFQKLFSIVTGDVPSDEDPLIQAGEQAEATDQDLRDAFAGTTPEEHEAAAVKN